jgi:hypothetical protein
MAQVLDTNKYIQNYWYGCSLRNNKLKPFIVKDFSKIPEDNIEVIHTLQDGESIDKLFQAYTKQLNNRSFEEIVNSKTSNSKNTTGSSFKDGEICLKEGSIAHTVIVMHQFDNGMANMLVLTSNNRWNPNCRSTTKEEVSWLRHTGNKRSYIAPYHDAVDDLISTGSCIGDLLLDSLSKEFKGRYLSERYLKYYHKMSRWLSNNQKV